MSTDEVECDPDAPVGVIHTEAILGAYAAHGVEPPEESLVYRLAQAASRSARTLREELADARGDYEVIRDAVIEQLNPRDDDIGEPSLMVESIEAAARFIDSMPCTCPPDAGPPEWETPCARCQALGRAKDERIDR